MFRCVFYLLVGFSVFVLSLDVVEAKAKKLVSKTFYYENPTADKVELIGKFNNWKPLPMEKDSEGNWTRTLELSPGSYPYKLRVDDEWITDPGNQELIEDADGNTNSIVTIDPPINYDTPKSDISSEQHPAFDSEHPDNADTKPKGKTVPFAGFDLNVGKPTAIDLPVVDSNILRALKTAYGHATTKIRLLIVLPDDFDPAKSYQLVLETATTDGSGSSVEGAAPYIDTILSKNAVLLAVDGESGKPTGGKGDTPAFRWAINETALQQLYKEWPASKEWPIITAGISGGAGYASYNGIMLVTKRYPIVGMFLANSGWNPANFSNELRRAPNIPMRKLPIFMTAGKHDPVATKEITDRARSEIDRERFKNVRYEFFSGTHELSPELFAEALDWFPKQK